MGEQRSGIKTGYLEAIKKMINRHTNRKIYIFYLFIFRERGREGGREEEKHQCVVASQAHYGNLACNPGVCPDWESNQRSFGSQASTQFTEPHQPGHIRYIFSIILFNGLMAFNLIKVL